jgi:phosphate starvation-inducible protein PhoH
MSRIAERPQTSTARPMACSEVDVVRHPLVKKIIVRYEARNRERTA